MQQLEALAAPLGVSPMVLVALLGVVTLFASRLMANLFRGNRPPIHEGIPFVGGLIKFAKVRCDPLPAACPQHSNARP